MENWANSLYLYSRRYIKLLEVSDSSISIRIFIAYPMSVLENNLFGDRVLYKPENELGFKRASVMFDIVEEHCKANVSELVIYSKYDMSGS